MTERDGDELDDSKLRALRSVWLEMRERDDDPPARGMAELLAAARAHAAHRRPSAWQRAVAAIGDALRRPPVMALAGITLVVGAAVLVERHRPLDDREPSPVWTTPVAPAAPGDPGTPVDVPPRAGAGFAAGSGAPASAGDAAAVDLAPTTPKAEPGGEATRGTTSAKMVARPTQATVPPPAPAKHHAKANALVDDEDGAPGAAAKQVAKPRAPEPTPAPSVAPTDGPAPPSPPPPAASFDQLWRDYQAAVTRGDCGAARSLDATLRAQYADRYRGVRGNAPASNCVAL